MSHRVSFLEKSEDLKVILIRDKISKLSNEVSLQGSLLIELTCDQEKKPKSIELAPLKVSNTKQIELKSFMDPKVLAEQAVGLNLKLMKWR